jgi:myo-inositol-1-phosphate synthase
MEGTTFGDVPLRCELKLEVWDSPNSAGVVVDAIRCARLALDRQLAGALVAPSSWFMKSPPLQCTDEEARTLLEEFIRESEDAPAAAPRKKLNGTRVASAARLATGERDGGPHR